MLEVIRSAGMFLGVCWLIIGGYFFIVSVIETVRRDPIAYPMIPLTLGAVLIALGLMMCGAV
jgi:hypothetical protein